MTRRTELSPVTAARSEHVRRRRLERWWLVLVVMWSILRIVAVWHWLERYGVDPVLYAMIDLGSSVPYAIAGARTVGALVDRRRRQAVLWGGLAVVCFIAPDVYIAVAGRQMPWAVYAIVSAVVVVAGGWALWTARRDVADARGRPFVGTGGVVEVSGPD